MDVTFEGKSSTGKNEWPQPPQDMWRCEPFIFTCRGLAFKGYIHSLFIKD